MWILLLIIIVMPFEKSPYLHIASSFLGIVPDFTVIKLLGLLGIVWTAFQVATGQVKIGFLRSRQERAFVLLLGVLLIASIAGGAGSRPVARILSTALLLPLVLAAIRTEADLRSVLKTAAFALIWILPYGYRQQVRFGGRYGVGLYEPNYLAAALVLMLPLAIVFARQEAVPRKRNLWILGAGVLFLSVILTGSRGGFLGLVVGLMLLAVQIFRRRFTAVLGVSFLLFLVVFVVPNTLGRRVRSVFLDDVRDVGAEQSLEGRSQLFKAGLRMVAANPLTGVGLGNFKSSVGAYGSEVEKIAHNTYLELAAEQGLPALFAFLYLIGTTFRSLRRSEKLAAAKGNGRLHELAVGMRIGLIAFCVSAAFVSAQFENFFWLILFSTICMERVARLQVGSQVGAEKARSHVWRRAVAKYG